MDEIDKEVHKIEYDQEIDTDLLTNKYQEGELHIEQQCCKTICSRGDMESAEASNETSLGNQADQGKLHIEQKCCKQNSSGEYCDSVKLSSVTSPGSQADQGKLHTEQKCCKRNNSGEDFDTSQADQDSGFENISSVGSSNHESMMSPSYFSSDESPLMSTASTLKPDESPYLSTASTLKLDKSPSMSTASTMQPDESPSDESPNTQCSKTSKSLKDYHRKLLNEEENHHKHDAQRTENKMSNEYKEYLQGNWKYLKKNIELSMIKDFQRAKLAVEDDLKYFKSKKRSQRTDMLLMRVIQRLENKSDLRSFEEIVGQEVMKNLTVRQANYYKTEESEHAKNHSRLLSNRLSLINELRSEDIEIVKDWLVEEFIININENDQIVNHSGFCEKQNKKFNEYFVSTFIINKSYHGSYQCLLESLKQIVGNEGTRLRSLLKSLERDDTKATDTDTEASISYVQTLPISSTTIQQEGYIDTSGKNCKVCLKLGEDNEQSQRVYDALEVNAKTKNGPIRNLIGGCIKKTTTGSIVMHIEALDKDMIHNIINKIRTGQFLKVVNLLFKDVQVKRYLPVGTNELEVACFVAEKQDILTRKTCNYSHQLNPIADNKSFLEEEMDTISVIKDLEKLAVYVGIEVHNGDREFRARFIMNKALSDETFAKMLHKVLLDGETTNVKERLMKYEKVYKSDSGQLDKNICTHFNEIRKKVFLDDIRLTFTERNIIKDDIFDVADQKSEEKNEVAMANILTEIIIHGKDAMLTLIDALYIIQLDKLADKLMTWDDQVDDQKQKNMKMVELVHHTKQANKTNSNENLLAIGKYELIVRRRRRSNRKRNVATKHPTTVPWTCKRKFTHFDYVARHGISYNDIFEVFFNADFRFDDESCYLEKFIPVLDLSRYNLYQHQDTEENDGLKSPLCKRFPAIQIPESDSEIRRVASCDQLNNSTCHRQGMHMQIESDTDIRRVASCDQLHNNTFRRQRMHMQTELDTDVASVASCDQLDNSACGRQEMHMKIESDTKDESVASCDQWDNNTCRRQEMHMKIESDTEGGRVASCIQLNNSFGRKKTHMQIAPRYNGDDLAIRFSNASIKDKSGNFRNNEMVWSPASNSSDSGYDTQLDTEDLKQRL